jgi:hypothetical protein
MTISRWSALIVLAAALPACGGRSGGTPLLPVELIWAAQNPQNVAITNAITDQSQLQMVSDGAGGAIVAWQDFRNGNADVYAQRIDAAGVLLWTVDGLGVVTGPGNETGFRILADGAGGALFVWEDFRSGTSVDLYAQRLNSAGVPQWTAGGKAVTTASGNQQGADLVADGAGGAIIAWTDTRGAAGDIYAQRVNGVGDPLWTADGVPVSAATGGQGSARLVPDGAGGAVAVWNDSRSGVDMDLYAQRMDANGAPQWTLDGVALSTAIGDQRNPIPVSDGSGGIIVVWEDNRIGVYTDIYAGRLTGAGTAPWTADGVAISTAPGYQTFPRIATDGAGGAILTWMDENGGPAAAKVYGQRLNPAGTPLWTAGGLPVSATIGRQAMPDVVPDGVGGAVFAWQDFRNGTYDIYAQRMNAAGVALWTTDGVGVSTVPASSQYNVRLVPNGFGGAVLAWLDGRPPGTGVDIYAQGVSSDGQQ